MKNSLALIVQLLLQKNKIPFDKAELDLQIQSHPSYPSLHAITGVLEHFGIENFALDLPQNMDVFEQLPNSIIAHLKSNEQEELVFVQKNGKQLNIRFSNNKKEILSIPTFLKQWSGIVVVLNEDNIELIQTNKPSKKTTSTILIGITLILGLILIYTSKTVSTFSFTHLFLSIFGIVVSYFLVRHELGLHSENVDKLCTATEKTSCDAVLHSKGATLFGNLKLSDVSFIYFSTLALNWVFNLLTNTTNQSLIQLLSFAAIPVILYSVYYQAVVVKKWCPLCLATASILTLQAITAYFLIPLNVQVTFKGILLFTTLLLTTFINYTYIKNLIKNNAQLKEAQLNAYKFKRQASIFNALYQNNTTLNTTTTDIQEIQLGNPNATNNIVLITNPLCGFCKAKHQSLERLLQSNGDEVNAIIRFNIGTEDKSNKAYVISNILLNLYHKDVILCKTALHQIYTDGVNVEKWLQTYSKHNTSDYYEILNSEKQWCTQNNINFTPAVYLNNKEYPREYDLSDLSLFLDDIIEEQNLNSSVITRTQDEVIS